MEEIIRHIHMEMLQAHCDAQRGQRIFQVGKLSFKRIA